MKILAIDAGNTYSGVAIVELPEFRLVWFGKLPNEEIYDVVKNFRIDEVALEMVACYGMPVGKDVFETCVWIGRFIEQLKGHKISYVYRKDEKMCLCGSLKAKDSNIRQALINRYAKHDFKTGKGTKKNQDVFYGVANDVWQAIAVAVTHYENKKTEGKD
jgi:hypothetical protein